MDRILVYSHDTYGLGNIRRMLSIATHLAATLESASVLLVSGSPMVHGFRIAPQVDYIKLPSVSRTTREAYSTRSLRLGAEDVFELRANLLLAAVADFKPDVMLVDKKPFGVQNELESAIYYAKTNLPDTALVLVLRDILDGPEATRRAWHAGGYTAAIESLYDRVLVLGTPDVFDPRSEYALPPTVTEKLRFCGYVRRPRSAADRDAVRRELAVEPGGKLVLVTPGGGQDGDHVLRTYVAGLPRIHAVPGVRSLIVTGPELAPPIRAEIERAAICTPGVAVREFTDDMMAYMDAADAVVCMGGYNTVCEVATLRKHAVVVPRVRPVEEQWIRAERLARQGIVTTIHPDRLDAASLSAAVLGELDGWGPTPPGTLDLGALPRVTRDVTALLRRPRGTEPAFHSAFRAGLLARPEASGRSSVSRPALS